jgi:hypothetical protein
MGLPNNYDQPLASLTDFGFEYDITFLRAISAPTWRGISVSDAQLAKAAAKERESKAAHRLAAQERYRKLYSALKLTGAMEEGNDASGK